MLHVYGRQMRLESRNVLLGLIPGISVSSTNYGCFDDPSMDLVRSTVALRRLRESSPAVIPHHGEHIQRRSPSIGEKHIQRPLRSHRLEPSRAQRPARSKLCRPLGRTNDGLSKMNR